MYYLGCLVGCLLGGWIAEKVGRIKVIALGSLWGVVGATLQCSAQVCSLSLSQLDQYHSYNPLLFQLELGLDDLR